MRIQQLVIYYFFENETQDEIQAASWNTSSNMNNTTYSFITSSNIPCYHIYHLTHTLTCPESSRGGGGGTAQQPRYRRGFDPKSENERLYQQHIFRVRSIPRKQIGIVTGEKTIEAKSNLGDCTFHMEIDAIFILTC